MNSIARRLRRHGYLVVLSLCVTVLFAAYATPQLRPAWLERFENLTYDLRLRLSLPNRQSRSVVIVDVDERSLGEEGRWPWPRDRLALLVDNLFEHYRIRLLGFDMVFAEPDTNPGLRAIRNLQGEQRPDPGWLAELDRHTAHIDRDARFAASLRDRPVVLGYYFQNRFNLNAGSRTGQLPMPILPIAEAGLDGLPFGEAIGYGANLPVLQAQARAAGFFDNPRQDEDGVIRGVPMLVDYQGALYESLALAVARVESDAWFIQPELSFDEQGQAVGLEALQFGDYRVPVDDAANALVPYLGPQGSFPYVSASDVLTRRVPVELLRDAIVLVGTTSPGLQDLRSTPVQGVYPGVEIHANLVAGILEQRIPHQPGYAVGYEVFSLLLLGLLLTGLFPWLSALMSIVTTVGLLGIVSNLNLLAWDQGLVLPLASSLLLIVTLFILHMAYGFITETRLKRFISKTFGQYVPPELVDEMLEQPQHIDLQGESRELTVLFSDVRGFTSLSEGLEPRELTALMNQMLTRITEIIHQQRGTIDKYMGDAVMAFWGAPLEDEQHAAHAVAAAMDMVAALPQLHEEFARRGWPAIQIGIGINTGEMNVGNMGSEFRMAYTVLGDAVNLGSRLEGLTKAYGVPVIVSESTRRQARQWAYRELDRVRVKGKDEPVTIYQPWVAVAQLSESQQEELALYHRALQAYRDTDWTEAAALFEQLRQAHPQTELYRLYAERVAHYREQPPAPGWDGVFVFETK